MMVDAIHDFQRMDPDWDDAFRPSKIPTTEGQFGGDGQSSVSVKQSRFGIKGSMPTGEGNTPLTFKFDFDLFGTGDNAGQTTFRLQNAYGEWGSLLAGQTDSLFMDIDVFPNTIDYWGPPGMVFYRNVQIRWTRFARTTVTSPSPSSVRATTSMRQRPPDRGLRGRRGPERRGAARSHRPVAHRRRLGAFPGRRDPAQGRV